jgi:hypothetical protein
MKEIWPFVSRTAKRTSLGREDTSVELDEEALPAISAEHPRSGSA